LALGGGGGGGGGGGEYGLWCKKKVAEELASGGQVAKIEEEGREYEGLKEEVEVLREKTKVIEGLEKQVKELSEKSVEQNAKIITLEEQIVVELKHREEEFVKEKKELETTLTSTLTKGEEERNLLLEKNRKLGELEEEVSRRAKLIAKIGQV